ncbi:MAG: DUF615 domain-containing protein [Azoarcus sp.]|jgi:ribosome-associated protein|nr:DUF615 domain-containing protein [Azoarcus sp.]
MRFHPEPSHSDDETGVEPPSKSSRKRAMLALQDLGAALVALSPEQLKKMPLPEALQVAIAEAQRLAHQHEALRRQMQYIGKLMRGIDPEPVLAQIDIVRGLAASEVARQHRLEKWRTDLLEDEKAIERIARIWPHADIQHLRTLRRNALKERAAARPPRAFREIFKVLRDIDAASSEAEYAHQTSGIENSEVFPRDANPSQWS